MIEQNILDWIELGDSIQKMDLYKKNHIFFELFYNISQQSNFSIYFYCFINFMYFFQISCLNIYVLNDVDTDLLIDVLDYFKDIFLIEDLIENKKSFNILLSIVVSIFLLSILLLIINLILIKKKIKVRILLMINGFLNVLNIYYLNGPNLEIIFSNIKCFSSIDGDFEICSFKETKNVLILIISIIYGILIILHFDIISLYFDEIGFINGTNVKCKISSNYTIISVIIKLIYFVFHFAIFNFIGENNRTVNLIYHTCFLVFNIIMSIYALNYLFYYNNTLNNFVHNGWYFCSWLSFCLFFKSLLKIRVVSLAIIIGVFIISIGLYFYRYYSVFNLVTKFNYLEANTLKDIENYNNLLLILLKSNDHNDKILLLGVIERFEEYISSNQELNEQYQKLTNDKHLYKKFSSSKELVVLSIIDIVYSYNIEKSKDIADLTLSMCYFLVNTFKNPTYAIWLCTKIKEKTHIQSYYKYVLMEEIKLYLLNNLTKNKNKISLRHVQLSSVILYNQYIDLFKMKIYDATCSQIEYFDLLKNTTTTVKTTKNFLKLGEDILNLKKDILNLWDKIITLNPFNNESQKDYMIYIEIILQDDALMRSEEKKYNTIKTDKLSERNNLYYSMFINDFSSVVISDGYSYNGKIIYISPNFSNMFLFQGKEVLNYSIDDLLPDVVQTFHKYLIEDAIKFSNLSYIFKKQRNVLLKGKNSLLFNINLFVKPSPNLSYGLIYFSNIQKTSEQNVILILDENLHINGFSGMIFTTIPAVSIILITACCTNPDRIPMQVIDRIGRFKIFLAFIAHFIRVIIRIIAVRAIKICRYFLAAFYAKAIGAQFEPLIIISMVTPYADFRIKICIKPIRIAPKAFPRTNNAMTVVMVGIGLPQIYRTLQLGNFPLHQITVQLHILLRTISATAGIVQTALQKNAISRHIAKNLPHGLAVVQSFRLLRISGHEDNKAISVTGIA